MTKNEGRKMIKDEIKKEGKDLLLGNKVVLSATRPLPSFIFRKEGRKMDQLRITKRGMKYGITFYEPRRRASKLLIVWLVFLIALLAWVVLAHAEVVNLDTIRQIESAGNPNAVSRTGACGLYQIMPCVLQEFNTFNKTNYFRADLFNPVVNTQIAKWYLTKRIPQMLRHYGKEVNTRNCIIAYNAGIRAVVKGYLPKETKNYLTKYYKLTERG